MYPANWEYNGILIIDELRQIIENNGGVIKPNTWDRYGYIVNRSITSAIREKRERIEQLEQVFAEFPDAEKAEARQRTICNYRADIEELERVNDGNKPVKTLGALYVGFRLNDYYYSVSFDENPFFPFHYVKTPIKNGKISRDACSMELKKDWLIDDLMTFRGTAADRREAANLIFNQIMQAPDSEIIRDSHKTKVPNTYDGGYHYETVYAPERFETLAF